MDTILISSSTPFSKAALAERLSLCWPTEPTVDQGLCVNGPGSRVYLSFETAPEGNEPCQLLLDYSDVKLVKRVIEQIADEASWTVNNDFGTILPGDQFVARCKASPEWDWRRSTGP
jgi:hypothetical protein